jgi:hypothetical protein
MDADDISHPDLLKKQVIFLELRTGIHVKYIRKEFIDEVGKQTCTFSYDIIGKDKIYQKKCPV